MYEGDDDTTVDIAVKYIPTRFSAARRRSIFVDTNSWMMPENVDRYEYIYSGLEDCLFLHTWMPSVRAVIDKRMCTRMMEYLSKLY